MPNIQNEVDNNYAKASSNYAKKKQDILSRIEKENHVSGEKFFELIQNNYKQLMQQKYTSDITERDVKLETILSHVYKAAEELVHKVLEDHKDDHILEQIDALRKMSQENGQSIEKEHQLIIKALDEIVEQYSKDTRVDNLMNRMLPDFISAENKKLSTSQVYAYTRSILKKTIYERAAITNIDKAVKKHPSIILGYIREDAVTQAALLAIETLQAKAIGAQTVGDFKTTIDIIIPISGRATAAVQQGGKPLQDIVQSLDSFGTSFVVEGESQYETDEFLGIQSKSWRLNMKTSNWNRNSVGSRAKLLHDFQLENIPFGVSADLIGWHRGVLFLSQRLEQVIGPNTTVYATGDSLTWTSDLLNDLVQVYHKYFAFMVDSNNKLTSHVQLADHYG